MGYIDNIIIGCTNDSLFTTYDHVKEKVVRVRGKTHIHNPDWVKCGMDMVNKSDRLPVISFDLLLN